MKKIEMLKNKIKSLREEAGQDGFSLLELVVAVGILLVLTVGGLLAYNGITDNARQAAVESAASSIYTGGVANESDNDTATTFEGAADEWVSNSQDTNLRVYVGETESGKDAVKVARVDSDNAETHSSERGTTATDGISAEGWGTAKTPAPSAGE